ncbi:hypothetical protein MRX96_055805 [Rhipicephalus microplus]
MSSPTKLFHFQALRLLTLGTVRELIPRILPCRADGAAPRGTIVRRPLQCLLVNFGRRFKYCTFWSRVCRCGVIAADALFEDDGRWADLFAPRGLSIVVGGGARVRFFEKEEEALALRRTKEGGLPSGPPLLAAAVAVPQPVVFAGWSVRGADRSVSVLLEGRGSGC